MTPEEHALLVAFEERHAELRKERRELEKDRDWYRTNTVGKEWRDFAVETDVRLAENAIRLDELDRLRLTAQVASMPSEGLREEDSGRTVIDGSVWPWPGDTRLPWQVWNEVPHPDGMTIYDPDGFRSGKPTVVTWTEFDRARMECTLVADERAEPAHSMPSGCPSDYLGGPGCTCPTVAVGR